MCVDYLIDILQKARKGRCDFYTIEIFELFELFKNIKNLEKSRFL